MIRQGLSGGGPTPPGMPPADNRLKPRTMILGLTVGESSEAFQLSVLRQARVINEEVGGQSVLIVHQLESDTTTAFIARVKGKKAQFDAANAEATEVTDRETGSRWDAYGKCISGPLKGSQLTTLTLEPEYWFAWAEFHPGTKIYGAADPNAKPARAWSAVRLFWRRSRLRSFPDWVSLALRDTSWGASRRLKEHFSRFVSSFFLPRNFCDDISF